MRNDLKIGYRVTVRDQHSVEEVTLVIGKSQYHWVVLWNDHPKIFKGLSVSSINEDLCKQWEIDSKYIGQKAYQISDAYIANILSKTKIPCEKCKALDILIILRATNNEKSSLIQKL